MKPTPSEAARAGVEAWLKQWRPLLADLTVSDLIARLTPVYERAQATSEPYTLVIHFDKRVVHRIGETCTAKVCP